MDNVGAAEDSSYTCIKLYHGTDFDIANKILAAEFLVKENRTHWLGNGIYFFIDKSLAKWWTTSPTGKFGCEISRPAIIECILNSSSCSILDLRNYSDYLTCANFFSTFCGFYRQYRKLEAIGFKKLRCAFFDWLFDTQDYDAIIGTFDSSQQPYYTKDFYVDSDFKNLNLEYTEVQVCIPLEKQNLLTSKTCYCI